MQAKIVKLLRIVDQPNGTILVHGGKDCHVKYMKQSVGKYVKKVGGFYLPSKPHKSILSGSLEALKANLIMQYASQPSEDLTLHRIGEAEFLAVGGSVEQQIVLQQLGCTFIGDTKIEGQEQPGWMFAEDLRTRVLEALPNLSVVGDVPTATQPAVVTLPSSAEKEKRKRPITRQTAFEDAGGPIGSDDGLDGSEGGQKKRQCSRV